MGDRILIVEDEQRLRDILCDYFRAKGEEPVGLENGQQAVEWMEGHEADAVLLDILMPELDGFTVCRALRRHSSVPIPEQCCGGTDTAAGGARDSAAGLFGREYYGYRSAAAWPPGDGEPI